MPDFISGASGADLEWYAGSRGVTKGTILNNATGPAKYGYFVTNSGINTPVGKVTPRFICKIPGFRGTSKWRRAYGLTKNNWTVINRNNVGLVKPHCNIILQYWCFLLSELSFYV